MKCLIFWIYKYPIGFIFDTYNNTMEFVNECFQDVKFRKVNKKSHKEYKYEKELTVAVLLTGSELQKAER